MNGVAHDGANRRLFTRPALQAGLVAFLVGLLAQVWAHRSGTVFAFWDSQAHLDIARRVIDSTTPGLQMLGTVWLPIPHLLLIPFTAVDAWWWNGTAGGIVGLAAFVAIVASVHTLLVRRTGQPRLAWFGTALVLLNPSLLYLQTTAMTEPVLLAFLVGSVVALDRWNATGSERALLLAGLLAALAIGTRYDGWFYALCATPVVACLARAAGRSWLRCALIFAVPCIVMVILWLGYNQVLFGDPLAFQRGVWSSQAQLAARAASGTLPAKGRIDLSLARYLGAALLTSGVLVTFLGLVASLEVMRHWRRTAPALLLLVALPFNVLALWAGQSAIDLPWMQPAGMLNLRYGIMVLPGLAVMMALATARLLTQRPILRRGILFAVMMVLVVQGTLFALQWPSNAGALREGLAVRDSDRRQQRASDWLATHYDGGRALVDNAVNVSPRTRIPIRQRVYDWTWQLGPAALAAPEQEVDWVIVDRHHVDNVVVRAIDGREAFMTRFDRVFADDGLEIWRRR